jgi:hypothetical protein
LAHWDQDALLHCTQIVPVRIRILLKLVIIVKFSLVQFDSPVVLIDALDVLEIGFFELFTNWSIFFSAYSTAFIYARLVADRSTRVLEATAKER